MHRPANLWIVLADEAGARLLRHRSCHPGRFEPLACACPEEDAPVDDGHDTGSCALLPRPTAPTSITQIAGIVNEAAALGLFDGLMLVAPPPTLGLLRRALRPAAGVCAIREEARNLLALPEPARAARLATLLRHR
ncbi:host attachment protein [Azospirillum sp. TSO35-2]|uniref:host attachment protein n=1 Tax=Azospirillum sp. TSO35-2 TaxID=716796 RepID=UPI000D618D75|nr:host attachment protein [Azospirillum sp. TSO35-2]PWC37835.1 hypothetical protein TSO352_10275 [Azospirillum sp. TSO35-2]